MMDTPPNILYFDCSSGAAGDMFVGALLDLGVDFDALNAALLTLGVDGYALRAGQVVKKGILSTKFDVDIDADVKQPHRHLRHVVEIIEKGDLPDAVKAASIKTFERIAECEAAVHGTTIEKVHFHEVGAVDSIVDVVGAHWALHALGIDRVESSAMHVGAGTVRCAHGVMPVPAPATARLLEGVPVYGGEVQGELVTPTGAALMAQVASRFGAMPPMTMLKTGHGAGTRDLPDRANVLRAVLGVALETGGGGETITVIEANIDDMSPELYPPLMETLLNQGARDAFLTPIIGKKGRPGHLVTVMCDADRADALTTILFSGSKTIGVRMRTESRVCLDRAFQVAHTEFGDVRVKVAWRNGHKNVAPEFEDCRQRADERGTTVLAVYESAMAAAVRNELDDA
jgi:pyridinium-3,5-bisthiocarboxylic acid mononucleotide nickel chelatase